MRNELDKWKNSNKFIEFQFALSQAKQKVFELKAHILCEENMHNTTDEQLIALVDVMTELQAHSTQDEFDFNFDYFSIIGTEMDILLEYIQRQKVWFQYLNRALNSEKFELASRLRDAIRIEKGLFINLIMTYRPEMAQDDMFYSKIDIVDSEFYNLINDKYK